MTKSDLLKNSANEVRHNPVLYAEFLRLYEEDGKSIKGCQGCNFRSAFESWKRENSSLIKTHSMSNKVNNTFKLKKSVRIVFVPVISETITKDSSDELVIKFLQQNKGKYFEKRSKAFFDKIPDALLNNEEEEKPKKKKRKRTQKGF